MKITVVGTGYVGLVTGTCFSESGATVVCVDKDKKKIDLLKQGRIPIFEPGLEPMLKNNTEKGRLSFTSDIKDALPGSEIIFIAVGTPPGEDGSADLSHVRSVASDIGKILNDYVVVATKSTVPVGTSEKVRKTIQKELDKRGAKVRFDMASNPEFLKEGAAVEDFLRPERIIIGVDNEKAGEKMKRLYMPFVLNNHPIFFMDIASAELTKYAANAMLATRISFINELANLCEVLGADINHVRKGIGSDSRIGNKFLYPGTGYGGSCFPKDVKAIIKTADDHGYDLNVIKAVEKANDFQKNVIFSKINTYFKGNLKNRIFGIWGLSFKPKTDDIRAYDPAAMEQTKKQVGNSIYYAADPYDALKDADSLVLMTEWSEFHLPDFSRIAKLMTRKVIFDGRNIYNPDELKNIGFEYFGIGRK
jgi:UDPglucose 6-dehydrogenase